MQANRVSSGASKNEHRPPYGPVQAVNGKVKGNLLHRFRMAQNLERKGMFQEASQAYASVAFSPKLFARVTVYCGVLLNTLIMLLVGLNWASFLLPFLVIGLFMVPLSLAEQTACQLSHLGLARCYIHLGQRPLALKNLNRSYTRRTKHLGDLYNGTVSIYPGYKEQALQYLEKARKHRLHGLAAHLYANNLELTHLLLNSVDPPTGTSSDERGRELPLAIPTPGVHARPVGPQVEPGPNDPGASQINRVQRTKGHDRSLKGDTAKRLEFKRALTFETQGHYYKALNKYHKLSRKGHTFFYFFLFSFPFLILLLGPSGFWGFTILSSIIYFICYLMFSESTESKSIRHLSTLGAARCQIYLGHRDKALALLYRSYRPKNRYLRPLYNATISAYPGYYDQGRSFLDQANDIKKGTGTSLLYRLSADRTADLLEHASGLFEGHPRQAADSNLPLAVPLPTVYDEGAPEKEPVPSPGLNSGSEDSSGTTTLLEEASEEMHLVFERELPSANSPDPAWAKPQPNLKDTRTQLEREIEEELDEVYDDKLQTEFEEAIDQLELNSHNVPGQDQPSHGDLTGNQTVEGPAVPEVEPNGPYQQASRAPASAPAPRPQISIPAGTQPAETPVASSSFVPHGDNVTGPEDLGPEPVMKAEHWLRYRGGRLHYLIQLTNRATHPMLKVRVTPDLQGQKCKCEPSERNLDLLAGNSSVEFEFELSPAEDNSQVSITADLSYLVSSNGRSGHQRLDQLASGIQWPQLRGWSLTREEWQTHSVSLQVGKLSLDDLPLTPRTLLELTTQVVEELNLQRLKPRILKAANFFRGTNLCIGCDIEDRLYGVQLEVIGGLRRNRLLVSLFAPNQVLLTGLYQKVYSELMLRLELAEKVQDSGVYQVHGDIVKGSKTEVRDSVVSKWAADKAHSLDV